MNNAIHTQFVQYEVLGVRTRLDPDRAYTQGLQMHDAYQAGLYSFADGYQYYVVVLQAQFLQGAAVGNIGDDSVGDLVGQGVYDFAIGIDSQYRVPHFH